MPIIAKFYGIIIKMYFQQSEHNPPHIHIVYGEFIGVLDIQTLQILDGKLPPKAIALVKEWAEHYKNDLLEIWNTQQFKTIPPLE